MDQQVTSQLPPKPDNCLVWAILTTVCCGCMPFGVVAIVFAAQVDGKYAAGDYHGAVDSANKAKTWCWVSFGIGLVGWIAYAILQVVVISAAQSNQYYY